MKVLSLFDGISCGLVALKRAGVKVEAYYASEIDKFSIQVSEANWNGIIRLGDVENWREWDIDWHSITLLLGGSPCQGFSFAGKQLAFDDPRSRLFFVYVDILNHLRSIHGPGFPFLLENVRMKQEYLDIISAHLGVEPICINSELVSAQRRVRYYWCNWPTRQPEDRGLELQSVLEDGYVDRDKSYCITSSYQYGKSIKDYFNKCRRQIKFGTNELHSAAIVGRRIDTSGVRKDFDKSIAAVQCLEVSDSSKSRCISTVSKDTVVTHLPAGRYIDVYGQKLPWRELSGIELERLMGLPDNYTSVVSKTQRQKQIGNAWQIDTLVGVLIGE